MTSMLIGVSATFIVLTLPSGIFLVYVFINPLPKQMDEGLDYLLYGSIATVLGQLNHGINLVLYTLAGTRFRKELKAMLCGCGQEKLNQSRRSQSDVQSI